MGKPLAKTVINLLDLSQLFTLISGTQHIVFGLFDRGPLFTPVKLSRSLTFRQTFGPRPDPTVDLVASLLYLAIERALNSGATLWVTRLTHLTDPTDAATVTALASTIAQDDQVPLAGYTWSLNEVGTDGDNFTVTIEAATVLANGIKVTLTDTGGVVEDEVYDDLSIESDSADYFLTKIVGGRLVPTDVTPETNATVTYPDDLPAFETLALAAGSNGTAINPASIIGDTVAGTGHFAANDAVGKLSVFAAHQNISSDEAVVAAGLAWAATGKAHLYFAEPPDQADAVDAIAFRQGTTPFAHSAFDSIWGALIYARQQVFDVVQGKNVLVPTLGELAPIITRAHNRDLQGAPWLAVAGPRRGAVAADVLGLSDNIGSPARIAEADDLSLANINPFVERNGRILFWGNQTLQIKDSLLSTLHVMFLVVFLKQVVDAVVDDTNFEPNSPKSWDDLANTIIPILEGLQGEDAFNNFRWLGDQDAIDPSDPEQLEVNTVAGVAAGNYKVRLPIQPFATIDAEITINIEITSTAVNFESVVG